MRELILKRHGKKGPATTRSSKSRQPMNGIWGTTRINITIGGYLTFKHCPSSHHKLLWISIRHSEYFGDLNLPTISPEARKLRMHHPRGQEKYISQMRLCTKIYNILQHLQRLAEYYTKPSSSHTIREYDEIYNLLISARREANTRVRRLHMMDVHSSQTIKIA